MKSKEEMIALRAENRAKPKGSECVCPWCENTFTKRANTQYSDSEKCGLKLRDKIGALDKGKRREAISKPVNKVIFVEQIRW